MSEFFVWLAAASGATKGFVITMVAATIGRFMFHVRQVQRGARRFWSWHLVWEIPTAIGMGLIADSMATWLELSDGTRVGFVAVIAYLGPHAIDELFVTARDAARDRFGGTSK